MVRERRRRRAALAAAAAVHLGGSAGGPSSSPGRRTAHAVGWGTCSSPCSSIQQAVAPPATRPLWPGGELGSAAETVPQSLAWLASHPARVARPPFSRRSRSLLLLDLTEAVGHGVAPRGSPAGNFGKSPPIKRGRPHRGVQSCCPHGGESMFQNAEKEEKSFFKKKN